MAESRARLRIVHNTEPRVSRQGKILMTYGAAAFAAITGYIGYQVGAGENDAAKADVAAAVSAVSAAQDHYLDVAPEGSCERVALIGSLAKGINEASVMSIDKALDDGCGANVQHLVLADAAFRRFEDIHSANEKLSDAQDEAEFDSYEKAAWMTLTPIVAATVIMAAAGGVMALAGEDH